MPWSGRCTRQGRSRSADERRSEGADRVFTTVRLPSSLAPPPLRLVRLHFLPPLAYPPVEHDLNLFVPREYPRQVLVEVRLLHDEQVWTHGCSRLCVQWPDFDSPQCAACAAQRYEPTRR